MKTSKFISKILFSFFVLFSLLITGSFYMIEMAKAAHGTMGDADITSTVKDKISANSTLSNANIDVSTTEGVVKLSGTVNTVDQMTTAAEVAQATTGVTDVDTSNIIITDKSADSKQPFTDALITAKVKGMFIQKKLFSDANIAAMSISVDTNNGIVSLSGTAESQEQIDNAIKIAKAIKDVKEVKSTVKIEAKTT
jgi:hyperosmotically inducible protein